MGRRARSRTERGEQPPPRLRGEARNAQIRAGLRPLRPGERPVAVTIAAALAVVMAAVNLLAALTGRSLAGDEGSAVVYTVMMTVILLVAAWGMWRARYWAVLGFQALLGIQIVAASLALLVADAWWEALYLVVIVGLLGWLFWKLIRAMARLQMPDRRPREPVR